MHWLLRPLAWMFASVVLIRRFLYDRGCVRQHAVGVFCVSIGALEAGGTGKTPVTDYILGEVRRMGGRPALLSRGYRRQATGLVTRFSGEPADPAQIGDEPSMLVEAGHDVPVAVCGSRRRGAAALAARAEIDAYVLDDAFSHRALRRDLDIVVLRASAPFGNGHLLPLGRLREPPTSLRRAQIVWLHRKEEGGGAASGSDAATGDGGAAGSEPLWMRALCPQAHLVVSCAEVTPPADFAGRPVLLAGRRLLAVAGIADPAELRRSLERNGWCVVGDVGFADHHRYTPSDVAHIIACADAVAADVIVTTSKDAIKLRRLTVDPRFCVIGTRVRVLAGGNELAQALRRGLANRQHDRL